MHQYLVSDGVHETKDSELCRAVGCAVGGRSLARDGGNVHNVAKTILNHSCKRVLTGFALFTVSAKKSMVMLTILEGKLWRVALQYGHRHHEVAMVWRNLQNLY